MTYYGRWTYKYEEAARRGAAGVLIVHETAPASYGWSVVKNSNTITMFDIVRQNPAAEHPAFESWIQRPLAEQIFAASGLNFDQAKAAAKLRGFKPVPLKATLTANIQAATSTITSHNVVGPPAGQQISRRDGHLHRALGPSRHRQAQRQRRRDLQRRGRQRHRHRAADRAGARLRPRPPARALGRVPRRHCGGEGPARQRILCGPPALPAGQDGCGPEHRCARHVRADAQLLDLRAPPSSTCSTI